MEIKGDTEIFGVVLWCDGNNESAVIWCEDHAQLAFYKKSGQEDVTDQFELQVRDLVKFDVIQLGELRMASNIALMSATEYPSLTRDLVAGTKGIGVAHMTGSQVDPSGNILHFSRSPDPDSQRQTA